LIYYEIVTVESQIKSGGGSNFGHQKFAYVIAPIEAVALTQDEWDNEDSFAADFARNGEVIFAA
jgi:hypothetical protein